MNFRSAEIYIERKTVRRLAWIAKIQDVTTDALADKLLNEVIVERWPQIIEAEKALKEAEQKFKDSLEQIKDV